MAVEEKIEKFNRLAGFVPSHEPLRRRIESNISIRTTTSLRLMLSIIHQRLLVILVQRKRLLLPSKVTTLRRILHTFLNLPLQLIRINLQHIIHKLQRLHPRR